MSGYNPSDDDNNETPLIIRTKNTDDADAVERNVGEQLAELTTEQQADLTIPTPAEVASAGIRGDRQDSNAGHNQQNIELGRLQNAMEVAKADVVRHRALGHVPNDVMNRFNAAANSYQYQANAVRRNTPDPVVVEAESDQAQLLSIWRTDMDFAVSKMMREERVDKALAMTLVDRKIAALGNAAVLPQYAKVQARMDRKYPKSDA